MIIGKFSRSLYVGSKMEYLSAIVSAIKSKTCIKIEMYPLNGCLLYCLSSVMCWSDTNKVTYRLRWSSRTVKRRLVTVFRHYSKCYSSKTGDVLLLMIFYHIIWNIFIVQFIAIPRMTIKKYFIKIAPHISFKYHQNMRLIQRNTYSKWYAQTRIFPSSLLSTIPIALTYIAISFSLCNRMLWNKGEIDLVFAWIAIHIASFFNTVIFSTFYSIKKCWYNHASRHSVKNNDGLNYKRHFATKQWKIVYENWQYHKCVVWLVANKQCWSCEKPNKFCWFLATIQRISERKSFNYYILPVNHFNIVTWPNGYHSVSFLLQVF